VQSANEAIIAVAGGGKTTRLVRDALSRGERAAMVTYTQNNTEETEKKLYEFNKCVPPHVEVRSWYSFLIRELARPYQNCLYEPRIEGMTWVSGRSDRFARKSDVSRFYFGPRKYVYSDKVSQFICECQRVTRGAVIRRLEQRFDRIYLDEIQDLAGYDIDLVELLLRSKVRITLVGDHRQSTFKTNNSSRHKNYCGVKIARKLREWEKQGLCSLGYELETHRSNQIITNLADTFYPNEPRTISRNTVVTGHDGIFLVSSAAVHRYIQSFQPQILRLDRRTGCAGYDAKNMGDSKGLTFDRVLIFPHGGAQKWLSSGDHSHIQGSLSKLYVGTTRARHSVSFVFDGVTPIKGFVRHS
jgi:DNA helicase II / ATP-dependent DNA helicase PcrA